LSTPTLPPSFSVISGLLVLGFSYAFFPDGFALGKSAVFRLNRILWEQFPFLLRSFDSTFFCSFLLAARTLSLGNLYNMQRPFFSPLECPPMDLRGLLSSTVPKRTRFDLGLRINFFSPLVLFPSSAIAFLDRHPPFPFSTTPDKITTRGTTFLLSFFF